MNKQLFLSERAHNEWLHCRAWRILVLAHAHARMMKLSRRRNPAARDRWRIAYAIAREAARFVPSDRAPTNT